jgi:hypothetical protein
MRMGWIITAIILGIGHEIGWLTTELIAIVVTCIVAETLITLDKRISAIEGVLEAERQRKNLELLYPDDTIPNMIDAIKEKLETEQSRLLDRIWLLERDARASKEAIEVEQRKLRVEICTVEKRMDKEIEIIRSNHSDVREWVCAISNRVMPPRLSEPVEWWENE